MQLRFRVAYPRLGAQGLQDQSGPLVMRSASYQASACGFSACAARCGGSRSPGGRRFDMPPAARTPRMSRAQPRFVAAGR
jgi:hypothetical protein